MLTPQELLQLDRRLRDSLVLSVYLDDQENDPARKGRWRTELDEMTSRLERSLPPSEVPRMRRALQRIGDALTPIEGHLASRGWVGFATEEELAFSAPCEAPMPRIAVWQAGPLISPYVRELKENRPVVVVVADHLGSRVLRYEQGGLREIHALEAKKILHRGTIGASHQSSSGVGMRSETRADAADKARSVAVERMVREVVREILSHTDDDVIFLLGGNAEVVAAVQRGLPPGISSRSRTMSGIGPQASEGELLRAVQQNASGLSAELQVQRVRDLIDLSAADGAACLSPERAFRSLQMGAVDRLLVSRTFSRDDPQTADRLIRSALEQSGRVEEVAGEAASLLDPHGGVAARLRYAA